MKLFRRMQTVIRGRRLLAAGAFVFLGYVFANNLRPWPRYEVQTEAKTHNLLESIRGWPSPPPVQVVLNHVSDDGRQVIVGVYDGNDSWLKIWDARTGMEMTPVHWRDAGWRRLLDDRLYGVGMERLLADPAGREFLQDAEAWTTLCKRLSSDHDRNEVRPRYRWQPAPLPFNCIALSADGRLVARQPANGPSGPILLQLLTGGPVVEEVRTGRRVVTFPIGVGHLLLAPGGRSAVSGLDLTRGRYDILYIRSGLLFGEEGVPKQPTDQPYLRLWDLERRKRRGELLLPHPPHHVEFSPDGQYLFATAWSNLVRVWDAETGQPVADLHARQTPHFMDGGRLLVAPSDDKLTLHFWETATGQTLPDWDLAPPRNGAIDGLTFAGDRFVFAEVNPNAVPPGGSGVKFLDKAEEWISERMSGDRKWKDHQQVIVLDAVERRTLCQVPGITGSVSPNGHWLATLDADGVVRVWELPLGRPWVRGFAYAAAVFLGGWVVFGLPRRLRRRPAASGAA
jgi:hypothetical protein